MPWRVGALWHGEELEFMSIVFQVIVAILVFGLLIFVHDLGHFTVGKLSGMRVNEFAMGMGQVPWTRTSGEPKYSRRA